MYTVQFDDTAIAFLEKSEKHIAHRIWSKLQKAKENPHRYFERLQGRTDYKLRVGDYRAIADIHDAALVIQVTLIEHRKKVYEQ